MLPQHVLELICLFASTYTLKNKLSLISVHYKIIAENEITTRYAYWKFLFEKNKLEFFGNHLHDPHDFVYCLKLVSQSGLRVQKSFWTLLSNTPNYIHWLAHKECLKEVFDRSMKQGPHPRGSYIRTDSYKISTSAHERLYKLKFRWLYYVHTEIQKSEHKNKILAVIDHTITHIEDNYEIYDLSQISSVIYSFTYIAGVYGSMNLIKRIRDTRTRGVHRDTRTLNRLLETARCRRDVIENVLPYHKVPTKDQLKAIIKDNVKLALRCGIISNVEEITKWLTEDKWTRKSLCEYPPF
jgi:hypothetical protein